MNGDQIVVTNYATTSYVTNAITDAITGLPDSLTSLSAGTGICVTTNPVTNIANVALDATLNDLTDVNASSPVANQVLTWDGICWYPAIFSGTGISPYNFIDMEGTPPTYLNNHLLQSNSDSLVFIPNNFVISVTNGPGIGTPLKVDNDVRLEVDLETYPITNLSTSSDQFVILQDSGGGTYETNRIEQNNILLQSFGNAETFIQNTARSSITGTYPITYDFSTGNIGLCGSVMTGIDFNNDSVTGILSIENGGTSAGTSYQARVNLGLSYNTDILHFQNPRYNGFMKGTNVIFSPGTGTINVLTAGTGYDGVNNYVMYNNSPVHLNVITGSDGEICSASLQNNEYGTLLYSKILPLLDATYTGSNTGYVQIVPDISYINFGLSQGENGFGFRNNEGIIEYKYNSTGVSWYDFENFINTVTGMNDVSFLSAEDNNILVYKNGKYESTVVTGQAYIDSGQFVITGPVNPITLLVDPAGPPITSIEFTTLRGICSNIQQQLDTKINSDITASDGSILYYNSSSSGSSWTSLPLYNEDQNKVLTAVFDSGISSVAWENPFESIGNSMIPSIDSTYDIGTSTVRWHNTFTDILNLHVYDVSTVPEGICGSLAVISNGNYGDPCLGLYWGTSWKIIGISGSIQAS